MCLNVNSLVCLYTYSSILLSQPEIRKACTLLEKELN